MAEMTVKRLGIVSVGKMYGLLSFLIGLIIGVIYGLTVIIFGATLMALAPNNDGTVGGVGTVAMGIVIMIAVPLLQGLFGFIAGMIGAIIYNCAARVVGGIKLELEAERQEYAAPPQWAPN